MLSDDRNLAQSEVLQRMIPLDRRAVLDVGCGDGAWSRRIAERFPWLSVVGVDVGEDFISRARSAHASPRVSFELADFADLPFDHGSFDCVYADNSLEHAFDVQATLAELHRVLVDGGVLVAAIPADALNPSRICDNHTWKTEPGDVRRRLESVGFADVSIDEIDVFRELGMSPYPPSQDRMLYVRAWKRERPATAPERAAELTSAVHRALDPSRPQASDTDPIAILIPFSIGTINRDRRMTEPDVTLTDYMLFAECASFAWLIARRPTDVGCAIRGKAVWRTAVFLQGRGRVAPYLEQAGYPQGAAAKPG